MWKCDVRDEATGRGKVFSIQYSVFSIQYSVFSVQNGSSWLGCGESAADRGFGDGTESLGGIVLVPVQLDPAQAVGVRLEGEGMEERICAE